jgi:hypothetical protein
VVVNWGIEGLTLRGALLRTFRLGSTSMHLYRAHMSASDCERKRREARRKVVLTTIALPGNLLKPKKFVWHLSRIAYSLGVLHAYTGRRYRYYG